MLQDRRRKFWPRGHVGLENDDEAEAGCYEAEAEVEAENYSHVGLEALTSQHCLRTRTRPEATRQRPTILTSRLRWPRKPERVRGQILRG